ncbi:MAG: hypothetical protein ACYTF8_02350, partial [Planctomycetota bacterium]
FALGSVARGLFAGARAGAIGLGRAIVWIVRLPVVAVRATSIGLYKAARVTAIGGGVATRKTGIGAYHAIRWTAVALFKVVSLPFLGVAYVIRGLALALYFVVRHVALVPYHAVRLLVLGIVAAARGVATAMTTIARGVGAAAVGTAHVTGRAARGVTAPATPMMAVAFAFGGYLLLAVTNATAAAAGAAAVDTALLSVPVMFLWLLASVGVYIACRIGKPGELSLAVVGLQAVGAVSFAANCIVLGLGAGWTLPAAILAAVLAVRAVWVLARATADGIRVPPRSKTRQRYHRQASLGVAFVLAAQFVLFRVWALLAPGIDGSTDRVLSGLLPQLVVLGAGAWLAWCVSRGLHLRLVERILGLSAVAVMVLCLAVSFAAFGAGEPYNADSLTLGVFLFALVGGLTVVLRARLADEEG